MRFVIGSIIALWTVFIVYQSIVPVKAEIIEAPIVVELFTSQSCSSCPPADKILGQLSKNKNVIALSCHVTYWNYLHWKDTLSTEECTNRQRDYARTLQKRGPYTPQMLINGTHDVVGNRSGEINRLINKVQKKEAVAPIGLQLNGEELLIHFPDTQSETLKLPLFIYGDQHTQSIPSGENRGRTVSYTNPVSEVRSLGLWDGRQQTITVPTTDKAHGYAILAQEKNGYGKVIAAGKLEL
ncbi:MAG: DUF1223 domain-containing protein [Alphaproteobacteria bacterium]|nr:DUF1223 domain-containing protein [Alphaproteobacteria bacterium]